MDVPLPTTRYSQLDISEDAIEDLIDWDNRAGHLYPAEAMPDPITQPIQLDLTDPVSFSLYLLEMEEIRSSPPTTRPRSNQPLQVREKDVLMQIDNAMDRLIINSRNYLSIDKAKAEGGKTTYAKLHELKQNLLSKRMTPAEARKSFEYLMNAYYRYRG